jgi:hypothetical protein
MLRLIFNDYQNTLLAIDHDVAMSEKMLLETGPAYALCTVKSASVGNAFELINVQDAKIRLPSVILE